MTDQTTPEAQANCEVGEQVLVTRRFLLTWRAFYLYFPSETWCICWRGLRWQWMPWLGPGMGCDGWTWHWLGLMIERACFDDDDWGEQKADDLAMIFQSVGENRSSE